MQSRSDGSGASGDDRFLVLAPTGRDATLTCHILAKAGIAADSCADMETLCRRVEQESAAGLMIAEEVLVPSAFARLRQMLLRQEPWSDIPILLFTGEKAPML